MINLKKILYNHKLWLDGNGGCRANLKGSDLRWSELGMFDLSESDMTKVNFKWSNLTGINLRNSILKESDFKWANLSLAILEEADLSDSDLRSCKLMSANLSMANLRKSDLRSADLRGANLRGTNLKEADLRNAILKEADLRYSDLSKANITGANLSGVSLSGANLENIIVPSIPEGDLIGWKKLQNGVIAKLLIPAEAKRSIATGTKCRASFAKVLSLSNGTIGYSLYIGNFVYETGQNVYPHEWNSNRWEECTGGIHFFLSEEEAKNFN